MKSNRIVQVGILLLTATLANGCSTTSSIVKTLAKDPASWQIHVVTPWGTCDYIRTGWTSVTNTCGDTMMLPTFQGLKK